MSSGIHICLNTQISLGQLEVFNLIVKCKQKGDLWRLVFRMFELVQIRSTWWSWFHKMASTMVSKMADLSLSDFLWWREVSVNFDFFLWLKCVCDYSFEIRLMFLFSISKVNIVLFSNLVAVLFIIILILTIVNALKLHIAIFLIFVNFETWSNVIQAELNTELIENLSFKENNCIF